MSVTILCERRQHLSTHPVVLRVTGNMRAKYLQCASHPDDGCLAMAGAGNMTQFKVFTYSLCVLVVFVFAGSILFALGVGT